MLQKRIRNMSPILTRHMQELKYNQKHKNLTNNIFVELIRSCLRKDPKQRPTETTSLSRFTTILSLAD